MDKERRVSTLGGGLVIPELPELTGRADIPGSSPICVGGSRTTLQGKSRARSPSSILTIGRPLYSRSRSPSPSSHLSHINANRQDEVIENSELRNFAKQPSVPNGDCLDDSPVTGQPTNDQTKSRDSTNGATTYGTCPCGTKSTPRMDDMFRRRLRFFFMNPCEKWRAKRRFPYKLILQLVKIILVTMQVMAFGSERSAHVDFLLRNNVAFKHLYLMNWNSAYETIPYPPTIGAYAVYETDPLLDTIDFALDKYNLTKRIAIGSYDFHNMDGSMPPVIMCVTKYESGKIWPHNQSFAFNSNIVQECYPVTPVNVTNNVTGDTQLAYDIRQFMAENDHHIVFDRLNKLELKFALKTVHLTKGEFERLSDASCFQFNIVISYDNSGHNGQVLIDLVSDATALLCNGTIINKASDAFRYSKRALDCVVTVVGSISLVLCIRTLINAHCLQKASVRFFKHRYNRNLTFLERTTFLNLWDVLIVFNDALTVSGTILKIKIESTHAENYEVCGMLLGTGMLLVWLGVLRYLSFFEHWNILILTMKQAIPEVGRFLVCAAVLYLGFAFCGWIVLGPYHVKFDTLGHSSECLFALINGDEIFVTYNDTRSGNPYVYYFSRIYLYTFISVFMYVVYSIFTSIIITTYETIKFYYREGFPKNELQMFMNESDEDASSPLFRTDRRAGGIACLCCTIPCISCCCTRNDEDSYPDEFTALVN